MDGDIEALIAAFENSTRREILRRLTYDVSYANELSRMIGVSQQAIIKHLYYLQESRLIRSVGVFHNSSGAARKIYKPTGFSTLIIDYARDFFQIEKIPLAFDDTDEGSATLEKAPADHLFKELRRINSEIEQLNRDRASLIKRKARVIRQLREALSGPLQDSFIRDVLNTYIETLDVTESSRILNLPPVVVTNILRAYGVPV